MANKRGMIWTLHEEEEMMEMRAADKTINEIAEHLGRTPGSVKSRIRLLDSQAKVAFEDAQDKKRWERDKHSKYDG